jgi:gliding motility-associated-like protein
MLKYSFIIFSFLLIGGIANAQPANDNCSNAQQLCGGQTLTGTTTASTASNSEDYDQCPLPQGTIWYKFTTNNAPSDVVTISFTNLTFNTDPAYGQEIEAIFINATTPCDKNSYTPRSTCVAGGVDFDVVSVALDPNTEYYVMINAKLGAGTNPAECDFDISISGTPVDNTFPTASISAADTILCQGDEVPVETIIANCQDTATFDWYYNDTLISSSATNDFSTAALSSSGYLKLIINCGDLCVYADTSDSIYFDVTLISANAGPDKFIQEGNLTSLEGSGDGSPLWTPANTLTSATSFTPTANPDNTTTYFLTVSNGACEASDSVNVFVGEVITIYKAFSPNGDGINDKWVIKNSAQYPNMEVVVYDRSGQRVFQTTGYSTPDKWWDGTNKKGKALPVSTYFYVVDLRIGDEGIFKGQVNIIR